MKKINKGEFSIKLMKEVFQDIFYGKPKPKTRIPSITKAIWEDDDKQYSCWKIDTGSTILYTNDAGKESFELAMKKDLEK